MTKENKHATFLHAVVSGVRNTAEQSEAEASANTIGRKLSVLLNKAAECVTAGCSNLLEDGLFSGADLTAIEAEVDSLVSHISKAIEGFSDQYLSMDILENKTFWLFALGSGHTVTLGICSGGESGREFFSVAMGVEDVLPLPAFVHSRKKLGSGIRQAVQNVANTFTCDQYFTCKNSTISTTSRMSVSVECSITDGPTKKPVTNRRQNFRRMCVMMNRAGAGLLSPAGWDYGVGEEFLSRIYTEKMSILMTAKLSKAGVLTLIVPDDLKGLDYDDVASIHNIRITGGGIRLGLVYSPTYTGGSLELDVSDNNRLEMIQCVLTRLTGGGTKYTTVVSNPGVVRGSFGDKRTQKFHYLNDHSKVEETVEKLKAQKGIYYLSVAEDSSFGFTFHEIRAMFVAPKTYVEKVTELSIVQNKDA